MVGLERMGGALLLLLGIGFMTVARVRAAAAAVVAGVRSIWFALLWKPVEPVMAVHLHFLLAAKSRFGSIYKRDYVSVTLQCHIYDLAMRKI
jgi:hypothetical protein